MMDKREDMPPWMLCQEILVKSKNELVLEAIDALHREADAKRIDITGSTIKIEGKDSDIDRDIFVINNLLAQENEIRERYGKYIDRADRGEEKDPAVIERVIELRKFLLSLTEIHLSMKYAKVFDRWVLDVGSAASLEDPKKIIAETAKADAERIDALEFVIEDRKFMKNEGLSNEEMEILRQAFFICKNA